MLGAIKYNLRHLLDFSGRDARQTFWYYVLFLFIVYFVLGMVGSFVLIGSLMGPMIEVASQNLPEPEMQAEMAERMGGVMGRMMETILWVSVVVNVVMDLLLAAAFVRRLHDSNSAGWWALAVLAAQVASLAVMIPMIEEMQEFMAEAMDPANLANPAYVPTMLGRDSPFGLYGLIGWISPIVVIVFGVLPSTEGPNRFGEAPVRF